MWGPVRALVKVKTICKSDLAKVTFANSITLTPGTSLQDAACTLCEAGVTGAPYEAGVRLTEPAHDANAPISAVDMKKRENVMWIACY